MYAVIKTGGKQYRVKEGDLLEIDKLGAEKGRKVIFDRVLLIEDEGRVLVGTPVVENAVVRAEVVENFKGEKVLIFKKKRRKQYRRTKGHRQELTKVRIEKIYPDGTLHPSRRTEGRGRLRSSRPRRRPRRCEEGGDEGRQESGKAKEAAAAEGRSQKEGRDQAGREAEEAGEGVSHGPQESRRRSAQRKGQPAQEARGQTLRRPARQCRVDHRPPEGNTHQDPDSTSGSGGMTPFSPGSRELSSLRTGEKGARSSPSFPPNEGSLRAGVPIEAPQGARPFEMPGVSSIFRPRTKMNGVLGG